MDSATRLLSSVVFLATAVISTAISADNLSVDGVIADGKLADVKSVLRKTSHPDDVKGCRGFSLKEDKIREFFKSADQVTSATIHNEYEWAPCEVVGHFLYKNQIGRAHV